MNQTREQIVQTKNKVFKILDGLQEIATRVASQY